MKNTPANNPNSNGRTQTTEMVSTKLLRFDKNVRERYSEEHRRQTRESIRLNGIINPLLGRRSGEWVSIIDGRCRALGAIELGIEEVPVTFLTNLEASDNLIREQLICNTIRENFGPEELGEAFDSLVNQTGKTVSELCTELGYSSNTSKKLLLRKLPVEILQRVNDGRIPCSSAYLLTHFKDSVQQAELASQIAEGKLTREALEHILRIQKSGQVVIGKRFTKAQFPTPDGGTISVSGSDLSLESLVSLLDWLLKLAKKEMRRGLELDTFVRYVRDQATARK